MAEVKVVVAHNDNESTSPGFKFKDVPPPSRSNAASDAKFLIVDGRRDSSGGSLEQLHDGRGPTEADQPGENFFFRAGTDGGRISIDMGAVTEIRQVNTYSWHPGSRGPQVYKLYASDGRASGFNDQPKRGTDPASCGWELVAKIDTRPKEGEPGGQYGVSISDSDGILGKYRHLLFDISRTEDEDGFGNTFYSEIGVIDAKATNNAVASQSPLKTIKETFEAAGGKYHFTIDMTQAPDLSGWATNQLAPVLQEWYPKIVAMLPSDGYEAPTNFSIVFRDRRNGVASTSGTRITCIAPWYRKELKGEAIGSVVHELVHVVQQYGRAERKPGAKESPGWLVEGLADYIRWFDYEPTSVGAEVRNLDRARYNASYRVTANFLNWVVAKNGPDLIPKLNAAMREGKYEPGLWRQTTGRTVEELGASWKEEVGKQIAARAAAGTTEINTLSAAEKSTGWKLLFDGRDLDGWHNFKREGVRAGWRVQDGRLVCVDPHNAGDIVTSNKFDWFELQLDYNISEGGNSGIMFHVTDSGRAVWATGPEFQLEDNAKAADQIRCGWLYQLYQPEIDPKTGKPLDATHPAGQWNHVRLLISPGKCEHEINGVKYFEYVLHSDDFNARVAKSKFARMTNFAKVDLGYISLQGDHGAVSFRNIKIRPIAPPVAGGDLK